jgi:hypothetical protein
MDWLQGALCLALSGMFGEIPILLNFAKIMGNMQPETAGRYAAYLFGSDALFLGFVGVMSVRDQPL